MEPLIKWLVRKFIRMVGWGFVMMTFACTAALIADLRNDGPNIKGGVIATTFFAVGSVALMRAGYRKRKRDEHALAPEPAAIAALSPEKRIQDDVVVCAEMHGWRLTITDVATDLNLGFGDARDALEALVKSGACTSETIEGRVVYDFTAYQKRAATRGSVRAGF